jgi:excisionase family DNA binding protein
MALSLVDGVGTELAKEPLRHGFRAVGSFSAPPSAQKTLSSWSVVNEIGVKAMKEVLTTQEACAYLRISRPTLLKLIYNRQIQARKIGRGWRILRSELRTYLRQIEMPHEQVSGKETLKSKHTAILERVGKRRLARAGRSQRVDATGTDEE